MFTKIKKRIALSFLQNLINDELSKSRINYFVRTKKPCPEIDEINISLNKSDLKNTNIHLCIFFKGDCENFYSNINGTVKNGKN